MINKKIITFIIAVIVVIISITFKDNLDNIYNRLFVGENNLPGVFSEKRLSQFNKNKLYLALTGIIYDVTKGKKHYGDGAPYHYFIGKDGSRAFITGNFTDESSNKDHVLDLSCDELLTLSNWRESLNRKYKFIGVLIGRYFDEYGKETEYTNQFTKRIEQCKLKKQIAKKEETKYPPCNVAWSVDEGTRVWCTKTSGGVTREWVGVPRQFYKPGEDKPLCVCVNLDKERSLGMFKEYINCPHTSSSCVVNAS